MRLPDPLRRALAGRALVAALVAVVVVAVVGVTVLGDEDGGDADPGGPGSPSAAPATGTPLAEVDTTAVAAAREPFCVDVDPAAVLRALGLPEEQAGEVLSSAWENGQVTRLEPGLRDVAHEHGCAWRAPGGVRARAWVFVPPVTRQEARELSGPALVGEGCTPAASAPAYGRPSGAADCTTGRRGERVFAGLLGDAWLTCTLAAPRRGSGAVTATELAERASPWCAAVLAGAAAD